MGLCPLTAVNFGTGGNNTWSGRPARRAVSGLCSGGRVCLRGHKREESFRGPETTTPSRESRARDANSILRHARERTQLLCGGGGTRAVLRSRRGDED